MTRRYVITAGPSAGKTTTIRELSARGYATIPESARRVIDREISEGGDSDEIVRDPTFMDKIEASDRAMEAQEITGPTILDRSLADCIAYRRHRDLPVSTRLIGECIDRYDRVFLLDRLPFEDDYARREDDGEATQIHQKLRETYTALGYEPIAVPVVSVDERCEIIEKYIP